MSQEAQLFMEAMTSNENNYNATTPAFNPPSEPTETSNSDKKSISSQKPIHNPNGHDDDLLPGVRFVVNRFTLYETKTRYYLFGTNHWQKRYRVLKIDRTSPKELVVIEEDALYTRKEAEQLLKMIIDGNRNSGGCNEVPMQIHGIIGFIKFTQGWYMLFITRRSQVALVGGHYIYHIDETKLVPIGLPVKYDKNSEEARYIAIFQNVDMTKNFYFSYTYDLTNTLQVNMTRPPYTELQGDSKMTDPHNGYNLMFVWNHHLLKSGFSSVSTQSSWVLPMIYGFVDQAKISVLGRNIFVTLIARRSRHFAGARFLKRGANDKGYVANDVETEQIVCEMATTSFHLGDTLFNNPRYTSYVQHRGSIPLFWSQDTTNMSPKPKIELNLVDPFFSSAALHFDNLFQRYGAPCIVLNLIKQKEKTKRESILGKEFSEAIQYLNQFLPDDKKIKYIAWDMSRASKSQDQDVIRYLEDVAKETMEATGFFHSGTKRPTELDEEASRLDSNYKYRHIISRQHGVLRTNCIDCLDRTNAAQFLMGKCALGHQLYALGIVATPNVEFDTDVVNIFTEMYHDHGDTIALQYGGSHLVNTMETYRKINQWTSHSRDMIEAIRRYYTNAFVDAEKQDAINLFLGNYVPEEGKPPLWELSSDYHLHNEDPRMRTKRRHYRKWWSENLFQDKDDNASDNSLRVPRELISSTNEPDESDPYRGYWVEYYEPKRLTMLDTLFAYTMNGTAKYRPYRLVPTIRDGKQIETFDYSPFTVRHYRGPLRPRIGKSEKASEEEVKIVEPSQREKSGYWTMEGLVTRSLDPNINEDEYKEYKRYTKQFNNVDRLTAVSQLDDQANTTASSSHPEYQHYLNYVDRNNLENNPRALQTQSIDKQVYSTYIDVPSRAVAVQLSRHVGSYVQGNARQRYDGYATYVRTGRFPATGRETAEDSVKAPADPKLK
ncbi:phosphatidylinositol-3 [Umbelopsis nana]